MGGMDLIEALGDPRFYVVFWLGILIFAYWNWRQHLANQRAIIFHLEIISRVMVKK